ncbi:ChbG/HpnK family deacetylase [Maribacter algicola]|uniref:ChbG/HpnK family deacetylase n=1 Tax=Meishania litoralis TaxID=3434685 RepID=A0ACC7LP10_9FLAO
MFPLTFVKYFNYSTVILINSDDFGASKEINLATYRAFKENLISSTTTLMNFKIGLEDAVSYVKSNKIDRDSVGIHLNLSFGRPLTEKMGLNKTLCDDGFFRSKHNLPNFFLNSYDEECILLELETQLKLFIECFGFLPSHIDSHQHVHTKWPVLKCVIRLAKKYNIGSVRISRNIEAADGLKKAVYKKIINSYIKINGFASVDKFGDIDQAIKYGIDPRKNYELMVHANLANGKLEVLDIDGKELRSKLFHLFNKENWLLVNYLIMKNAPQIVSAEVEFETVVG